MSKQLYHCLYFGKRRKKRLFLFRFGRTPYILRAQLPYTRQSLHKRSSDSSGKHIQKHLSVWEVLAKDHFVDALADTDIRWKAFQTRPGTVQEALATVTEVEAFQISERQRLETGRLTANIVGA